MPISYFRIQKNWTQPSLRMLLPLTEHEIYISRYHPIFIQCIHTMRTIKNNYSAGIHIMSAAWKRQVMSDEIEWFRSPYYSHLRVIAIIHLLFPCRSHRIQFRHDPRESTRLRKTGTIWKQNWHHCHGKQWNHMRAYWILIERSLRIRAHILSYHECSRHADGLIPREHHAYWQSITKRMV